MKKLFTVHIETPAGARFSHHDSEDEMRQSLIEYFNEVHADDDEDGEIPEDAELETVKERIEEYENVSIDETWQPGEKVWVCKVAGEYAEEVTVHRSRRAALEAANNPGAFKWGDGIEALDLTGMTDDEAEKALDDWWEEHGPINDQFTITETEIQD